jgi:hypothetical protein
MGFFLDILINGMVEYYMICEDFISEKEGIEVDITISMAA